MKTYNYEARKEDRQNNCPEPHPEELTAKIIPVYEQLGELEYAIEKLSDLQSNLIKRLEWVSNPCDRPVQEKCFDTKAKSERPESAIVQRINRSVENIKDLQYRLSIQLEDLDV